MLVDRDGCAVLVITDNLSKNLDSEARAAAESYRFDETVVGTIGVMVFRDEDTAQRVADELSVYSPPPHV